MVSQEVVATVTTDTSAYGAGDQIGSLITLTGVGPGGASGAVLRQVTVIDKSKQNAALNILLFHTQPTVASADQAAADVSDAQMAANAQGVFKVAGTDYVSIASNSVASPAATPVYVKPSASGTIYALVTTSGTPTYAGASDLVLRFHFTWE